MTDERAVSEVVGFILVFSLVIGTITFVYVGGYSSLQDTRDHEQMANAERAFDVLANNLEEIGRDEAPSRATEIKLANAQLSVDESLRSNVSVANESTQLADGTPLIYSRPLRYSAGTDTSIVYEYGAVLRVEDGGAHMIRQPDFVFSEHRTVLRYLVVQGGKQSVGGSTTVLVHGDEHRSSVELTSSDHENVTFQLMTSPQRAEAWLTYLEDELQGMNPVCETKQRGEKMLVGCSFDSESVYAAKTEIDVRLIT